MNGSSNQPPLPPTPPLTTLILPSRTNLIGTTDEIILFNQYSKASFILISFSISSFNPTYLTLSAICRLPTVQVFKNFLQINNPTEVAKRFLKFHFDASRSDGNILIGKGAGSKCRILKCQKLDNCLLITLLKFCIAFTKII